MMQTVPNVLAALVASVIVACSAAVVADEPFSGIGAGLKVEGGVVKVQKVFPGSGAEAAGLAVGASITHVDGKPVQGMDLSDVVKLVRGPQGTTVRLTVVKELGQTQDYTITRAPIVRPSPDTVPGVYSVQGSPSTIVEIKRIDDTQFTVSCPQQRWSGVGLLGNGYVKGVFRMEENPQVDESLRGAVSFFRIDFQFGDTLMLRSRFNFHESGDKVQERTLIRKTGQTEPAP